MGRKLDSGPASRTQVANLSDRISPIGNDVARYVPDGTSRCRGDRGDAVLRRRRGAGRSSRAIGQLKRAGDRRSQDALFQGHGHARAGRICRGGRRQDAAEHDVRTADPAPVPRRQIPICAAAPVRLRVERVSAELQPQHVDGLLSGTSRRRGAV